MTKSLWNSDLQSRITDDFVAAFGTDDSDYEGGFARTCAAFYPDQLPVGVNPDDQRVMDIIARIRKVQGMGD